MAVLQEQQGAQRMLAHEKWPRRQFLADLEGLEDASVVDTATEVRAQFAFFHLMIL